MTNKSRMLIDNVNHNNNILLLGAEREESVKLQKLLRNLAYNVSIYDEGTSLVSALIKEKPQLIIMDIPPGFEESALNSALDIYNNYRISFILLV